MVLEDARTEAERVAATIADLEYVVGTVQLPDFHLKEGMEAPSSFVAATRGMIVPHLVSESINDGMGLVATPLHVDAIEPRALTEFVSLMNASGAKTKLSRTAYSWTPDLVEAACREGARPLLENYGLAKRFLATIEDGGRAAGPTLTPEELRRLVPSFLRTSRLVRGEIGLNFGGNHFLEVQVVDRIVDASRAAQFSVEEGQVVVMYHLGPGPLGSILSNLHARRVKPSRRRRIGYGVLRHALHALRGPAFHKTFARSGPWLAVDEVSEEGKLLASVLGVIKNYGFAYRMGTVAAIRDALRHAFHLDTDSIELVVDQSHNMVQPEEIGGEHFWVSRHNCCRPRPGKAGIVAGSHNVASCLTVGPEGSDAKLGGFDHGVGFLIDQARRRGESAPDESGATTRRVTMTRGTDRILAIDAVPLNKPTVIEATMRDLATEGLAKPVAYLRPLTTLKHGT